MSSYAIHGERGELLAVWGSGIGSVAQTVATGVDHETGPRLADALTRLATAAWRTYTHPASAADDHDINGERWRREQERAAFSAVLDGLANPNLPTDGQLLQSYSPVTETAHQAGRVLHAIGDPGLTAAVVADVTAELAAIEAAERGELTGRARQAVTLTRADASPIQVAAADELLAKAPFGDDALFIDVEPTAAAIAAAHWFIAAVDVAAAKADVDPEEVIRIADDIQPVPMRTLAAVLELAAVDTNPRRMVVSLVAEAMLVADGFHPGEADVFDDDAADTDETKLRLSVLDPARPAHDLLEDLLTGINACWLVYGEYSDDLAGGLAEADDEESATEADNAFRAQYTATFLDAVRETAASSRDRLG